MFDEAVFSSLHLYTQSTTMSVFIILSLSLRELIRQDYRIRFILHSIRVDKHAPIAPSCRFECRNVRMFECRVAKPFSSFPRLYKMSVCCFLSVFCINKIPLSIFPFSFPLSHFPGLLHFSTYLMTPSSYSLPSSRSTFF